MEKWECYFFFKLVFVFLIIATMMAVSSFDSCNKPDSLFLGSIPPSTVNHQLTNQADDWKAPTEVPERRTCLPRTFASVEFGKAEYIFMIRRANFFVRSFRSFFFSIFTFPFFILIYTLCFKSHFRTWNTEHQPWKNVREMIVNQLNWDRFIFY